MCVCVSVRERERDKEGRTKEENGGKVRGRSGTEGETNYKKRE